MSIRVFLDGRVVEPREARISVFNRGFLFGESVFETVATVRGAPDALEAHLDRLERSAAQLGVVLPPRAEVARAVQETLAAAGNPESRVRIIATQRGEGMQDGHFELAPPQPAVAELVVIVQPLAGPIPAQYERGVAVEIVPLGRNHPGTVDPSIKSGSYLSSVLALREARRRNPDAHEAILCSPEGLVAEGATSNVFLVRDGALHTPALQVGILEGVTRARVLALARAHGLPCHEGFVRPDELRQAEEVFLTSAARGVLPVTCVDRRPIGGGRPGPVTLRLRALYEEQQRAAGARPGEPGAPTGAGA